MVSDIFWFPVAAERQQPFALTIKQLPTCDHTLVQFSSSKSDIRVLLQPSGIVALTTRRASKVSEQMQTRN